MFHSYHVLCARAYYRTNNTCLYDWELCVAIDRLGLVATCPLWTAEHGEWIKVDAQEQAESTVSCKDNDALCAEGNRT